MPYEDMSGMQHRLELEGVGKADAAALYREVRS